MLTYNIGDMVRSLAGHDKNKLYIITAEKEEYVYLSDGNLHGMEKQKLKNKKHIQVIYKRDDLLSSRLQNNEPVTNEEIKYFIKSCSNTI